MPRLLALLLLLSSAARAADSLSLQDAWAQAQRRQPSLLQSQLALDAARERQLGALAAFLPKLSLSAGQSRGGAYNPATGDFSGGSNGTSMGLSASQNLFRGFADVQALKQAQARLASAEEDLRLARAAAAYDVRQAWSDVLLAQQQLDQAQDTAQRRQSNVELVQLRFDAGRENKGSLLQTQAQALQAAADSRRNQRLLAASLRRLGLAMGVTLPASTRVSGDWDVPAVPADDDDAQLALQLPAVRKAQAGLQESAASLAAADAAFLPSLNASAGLNRNGDDWLPSSSGSWSLGLSLSWNLFNGFSDLAGRGAAAAQELSAELALEDARRTAANALGSARDTLLNALDQLEVRDAFLKASETRAEIAQAQYAQGLIGFEDWDRIESDLISARQQSLAGRQAAAAAGFAWQQAQAKGWEP
jgi:outer membrane protein